MPQDDCVLYSDDEEDEEENGRGTNFVVRAKKGAIVRSGADLTSTDLGRNLAFGSVVEVVEWREVNGSLRCRLAQRGWVSAKVLEAEATCTELAVLRSQALALSEAGKVQARERRGMIGGLSCTIVAVAKQPTVVVVLAPGGNNSSLFSHTLLVEAANQLVTDEGAREAAFFVPEGPIDGGAWWQDDVEALHQAVFARRLAAPGGRVGALSADLEPRVDPVCVERACSQFHEVVRASAQLTGAQQIFVGGIGHGATLAFQTFSTLLSEAPAGLFLFSPMSLFVPKKLAHKRTPVLLTHNANNGIVPELVSRAAHRTLLISGLATVDFLPSESGVISYNTVRAISRRIKDATGGQRPPGAEEDATAREAYLLLRSRKHRNLSFAEFRRGEARECGGLKR